MKRFILSAAALMAVNSMAMPAEFGRFPVSEARLECMGATLNWDIRGADVSTKWIHSTLKGEFAHRSDCYRAVLDLLSSGASEVVLPYEVHRFTFDSGAQSERLQIRGEFANLSSSVRVAYPRLPREPRR